MKSKFLKYLFTTASTGMIMWIMAGLWHNLILPSINENVEAHHEGIWIMLTAYFVLAFFMVYIFELVDKKKKYYVEGLRIGVIIGILWVFPHGLAMAGAHGTSLFYEIKNAAWHIVEQGIGGLFMAMIITRIDKRSFTATDK